MVCMLFSCCDLTLLKTLRSSLLSAANFILGQNKTTQHTFTEYYVVGKSTETLQCLPENICDTESAVPDHLPDPASSHNNNAATSENRDDAANIDLDVASSDDKVNANSENNIVASYDKKDTVTSDNNIAATNANKYAANSDSIDTHISENKDIVTHDNNDVATNGNKDVDLVQTELDISQFSIFR